jgi:hypothetical protein
MYDSDYPRQNKSIEWLELTEAMKELNRIKTTKHFNFELLLEGSDLGCFENCWSLGLLFFTHKVRQKELLELESVKVKEVIGGHTTI